MNKSKRRLWWAVGAPLLALVLLGRFKLAYDYSHVPTRTAVVPRPYPQAGQSVQALAFSPDGKSLFVADTQTGVSLWHLPKLVCDRRFENSVGERDSAAYWTTDGSTVVMGDSSAVRRWDVSQESFEAIPTRQVDFLGRPVKTGSMSISQFHAASRSGTLGAVATTEGDVVVWNLHTGELLFHVSALPMGKNGYPIDFCDIAVSPDDREVATTSMRGDDSVASAPLDVTIRAAITGRVRRHWQWNEAVTMKINDSSGGNLEDTGLTYSPDGTLLAASDNSKVAVWNAQTGRLQHLLPVPLPSGIGGYGGKKRIAFFDKNRLLASVGWGNAVLVWDVRTGMLLQTFYGENYAEALTVSPNDRWLTTGEQDGNGDGRLELWDVNRLLR